MRPLRRNPAWFRARSGPAPAGARGCRPNPAFRAPCDRFHELLIVALSGRAIIEGMRPFVRTQQLPAQRSSRAARLVAAVTAAAGLSLLVAACGSSPGSNVAQLEPTSTHPTSPSNNPSALESTTSESPASQMLAYSHCMRSHGEPSFPDPNAQGQVKDQLRASGINVNSSQFRAADAACKRLLPSGSTGPTQAEVQQEWSEFRSFARCMRRHGVPNWPDPQPRSATDPRPTFAVGPQSPVNPDSPQIKSKLPDCSSLVKTANPNRS